MKPFKLTSREQAEIELGLVWDLGDNDNEPIVARPSGGDEGKHLASTRESRAKGRIGW